MIWFFRANPKGTSDSVSQKNPQTPNLPVLQGKEKWFWRLLAAVPSLKPRSFNTWKGKVLRLPSSEFPGGSDEMEKQQINTWSIRWWSDDSQHKLGTKWRSSFPSLWIPALFCAQVPSKEGTILLPEKCAVVFPERWTEPCQFNSLITIKAGHPPSSIKKGWCQINIHAPTTCNSSVAAVRKCLGTYSVLLRLVVWLESVRIKNQACSSHSAKAKDERMDPSLNCKEISPPRNFSPGFGISNHLGFVLRRTSSKRPSAIFMWLRKGDEPTKVKEYANTEDDNLGMAWLQTSSDWLHIFRLYPCQFPCSLPLLCPFVGY